MFSEKRYRTYDIASNIVQTYMAVLMLAASVFSDELRATVPLFDKITIVLSLFLFGSSLIIYGFRFVETANKHRDCYLKLQRLIESYERQSDPGAAYHDILAQFPNHAPRDYEDFVLSGTLFDRKTLKIGDKAITWTAWMLISKVMREAVFWLLILILPAATTLALVWPFVRPLVFKS